MAARDRTWMAALLDGASMNPVGAHGSAAVTTSGTILTAPSGAQRLLFQPTSGSVRMMLTGTATDTNGFLFAAGAVPYAVLLGPNTSISFAATAGTASLMLQWLG